MDVSHIVDNIWIGDWRSALNTSFLQKNNIQLVINTTPNRPIGTTSTIRLPLKNTERLIPLFQSNLPSLLVKMNTVVQKQKGILVHCSRGHRRSVSVVAAYLVNTLHMTPLDAISFISKRRSSIKPCVFYQHLSKPRYGLL